MTCAGAIYLRRPRATSRSGLRCWRRRWPAARWCWATSRACASCGATRRCSCRRGDTEALRDSAAAPGRRSEPYSRARLGAAARRRAQHFTPTAWPTATLERYTVQLRRRGGQPDESAMRIVIFYHSLVSDWNHGNAHFLRGVVQRAARARPRGAGVRAARRLEPAEPAGRARATAPQRLVPPAYPRARAAIATSRLRSTSTRRWTAPTWCWCTSGTSPQLVRADRRAPRAHRALPPAVPRHPPPRRHRAGRDGALRPAHYDGVLAFGDVIRDLYLRARLGRSAPGPGTRRPTRACSSRSPQRRARRRPGLDRQLGRRGAHRRAARVPARAGARARACAPASTACATRSSALRSSQRRASSTAAGCPTIEVPAVFARHRVTVHVPRRPYVEALPGIPTIRLFEALACGIPLVSAPWDDAEGLFRPARITWSPATAQEMSASCAPCCTTRRAGRRAGARTGGATILRATPARTAWTSCWRSSPSSARAASDSMHAS